MNKKNILKKVVELLPNLDIINLKKLHKGEFTECYKLRSSSKDYFVKRFLYEKNKKIKINHMQNEINLLNRLAKVKSVNVKTPRIINYNLDEGIMIQDFFNGLPFNRYILINLPNKKRLKTIYANIGKYLANFHNKNFLNYNKKHHPISFIHGDLNNKNILISNQDKVFLCDPGRLEWQNKNSVYLDIARVICNLYPFNPIIHPLLLSKKRTTCIHAFLINYTAHTKFDIDIEELKTYLLFWLENIKKTPSSNQIKKKIIKNIIPYLIFKIRKDYKDRIFGKKD